MRITEQTIQAVLMGWAMIEKGHELVVPNSNTIFTWEADLLTFTKTRFIHEFEIKLDIHDYRRDAEKRKHAWLIEPMRNQSPNYFWYATWSFDIEPPAYAGWINVTIDRAQCWQVKVMKQAPRLHTAKASDHDRDAAARIMAHHVRRFFYQLYAREYIQQ
jgi:hypothetical protein